MTFFSKILATAGLAAVAVSAPAAAQVEGRVATADVSRAILGTSALQNAYNQIGTTYSAQIEQRRTKRSELADLLGPFDSNGNGQLDDAELPAVQNSANWSQIQTLEQELATITNQVNAARIFAVEQILQQCPAALTEVTSQQQVVMVLQPDTIQFAAEGADITPQITTSLNAKVPSVQIVPPADYRPSRNGTQIFQQIQQTLVTAQMMQQQQQAAEQGQQQP